MQRASRESSPSSPRATLRGSCSSSPTPTKEPNLEVGLSAFCGLRRGMPGRGQVCAEQIKIHVEGPPARHLESLAGPLLIPDLPVFLWYPNGEVPRSPECDGMASLADR